MTTAKRVAKQFVGYVLLDPIALYLFLPTYWALVTALKPGIEAVGRPRHFPAAGDARAFRTVFRNEPLRRSVLNSLVTAAGITLLSLLIGTTAAFALGKLRFRFKTFTLYRIPAMTTFPAIPFLAGL